MIDARATGTLRPHLPGQQRLSLEGHCDRYFTVHVPEGYGRDALGDLARQAATYPDPRAERPRFDVAPAGRRLRRRSAARTLVIVWGVASLLLSYPCVLGWLLDR